MSMLGCGLPQGPPSFAIAGLAPTSNATILSDKSSGCERSIPEPKSSKTSRRASTSSAKVCVPYWNDFCAATSSNLWLPTGIGLLGSGSTSSGSLLSETAEKSWFSIQEWEAQNQNSPKTCSPYSTTSLAECTDSEAIKAKRIRIYPNPQQRSMFRQWFGTSRRVYNDTVAHLNQPKELRAKSWMGAAKVILPALPDWAKPVPYQVKKISVEDAYKAFSNGCRKAKKTGEPFRLSFRSRKNPKQSCYITLTALKETGIYPTIAGKLKFSESYPDNCRDSRLVCEHGRWFVIIPYRVAITSTENQGRFVALDPGVRTFLTGYSEDTAFKLGSGAFSRIARLCCHMDDLISRMSKATCASRRRMKKALSRMRWKIWDLIDDLHFKSIRFLLDRFDVILLPTFEVSEMVGKLGRKLRAKSVRSMLTLAHFRFKQRIKSAARTCGKHVIDVNEAYTSKTASWTGEMKQIGGAKTIRSGGVVLDRDINGARGIFLRALVDQPLLRNELALVA